MFKVSTKKNYEDGQAIFEEGSYGDQVYVILSGGVEISKIGEEKKFIVNTLKTGEVFGELGFFGGFERTASATAVGKTEIGLVDLASADSELGKLSKDVWFLLKVMVERYKNLIDRASEATYRTDPRIHKTLSLTYQDSESFLKASSIKASTGNLSIGGLFVNTDVPLDKGEKFLLDLTLPDVSQPISINCEVAWVRDGHDETEGPGGMGVKFIEISETSENTLTQYLNNEMLKD
jgi:CRP/FNR family cyclic AMP-dependent transcriptional regulator